MRLLALVGFVFVLCSAQPGFAQQYRSKVLITPDGEMDKGAELSIEELEQQISSIKTPYAKSSAGRHLARHYVEQKEYAKAIEFYQTALSAQGLSDVANRQMLRELAQVYLLKNDYSAAVTTLEQVLQIDLIPEVTDYLLLAQAHYRTARYVAVVATLDQIKERGLTLNTAQMRQALALYYQAGAYAQCEVLLRQLLEMEPANPELWHQLASVYLQQNKKRQALDQLALAREKSVPFTERDVLLLADLHAANNNPYGAAQVLDEAIAAREIAANGDNYRKMFQFWFQAREPQKAAAALQKAAQLTGDIELYLYLAQLQMEDRTWTEMLQTMQAACARQLPDKYVSRANLLLGVSQLKLGDEVNARRSFINATLIGGANVQAGQWLEYMNAEPATDDEARRIVGLCYGSRDKRRKQSGTSVAGTSSGVEDSAEAEFQLQTVPRQRLFYASYTMPLEELAGQLESLVVRMGISLVKAGGSVDGPLQIISQGEFPAAGDPTWQLALPSSGSPSAKGKFRVRSAAKFKCATTRLEGEGAEFVAQSLRFADALQQAGYVLTGERRLVLPSQGAGAGEQQVELQLGIE